MGFFYLHELKLIQEIKNYNPFHASFANND